MRFSYIDVRSVLDSFMKLITANIVSNQLCVSKTAIIQTEFPNNLCPCQFVQYSCLWSARFVPVSVPWTSTKWQIQCFSKWKAAVPSLSLMSVVASCARKSIPLPNIQNVKRCRKGLQSIQEYLANSKWRPSIFDFNVTASARMEQYPAIIGMMNHNEGGIVPDADACTYRILTHNPCRMNQTDLGFVAFDALMKRGFRPDTIIVNTLIDDLCSEKRIDEAVDRMPLMDCKHDVITYNTIINAHCEVGSMEKALELLQEMIFKGILPDVITYNCVIRGHFSLGQWEEAFGIFEQMEGRGISPNVVILTTLIDGFSKSRKMYWAVEMLYRMLREGLKPDLVTFNRLIVGLYKVARMDDALILVDKMAGQGIYPNAATFTTLIVAFCKMGYAEEAHKLLNVMIQRGIRPEMATFRKVIDELCEVGRMDDAHTLLEVMLKQRVIPDVAMFNMLIAGLCKVGRMEDAKALLDEMIYHRIDPNVVTFQTLINPLCALEAQKFVYEVLRSRFKPDISTYSLFKPFLCEPSLNEEIFRAADDDLDYIMQLSDFSENEEDEHQRYERMNMDVVQNIPDL